MYVKFAETQVSPAELIKATDSLRWGRVWVDGTDLDPDELMNKAMEQIPHESSIISLGCTTAFHDSGYSVNWVHWLNEHLVGMLAISTSDIYILSDEGKTIDKV